MKFKVGDKVISKYGSRDRKGTIVYIDNSSIPYKFIDDDEGLTWWFEEQDLEHIKEDLRDLLQVGYKVHYEVFREDDLEVVLKGNNEFNSNLMGGEQLLWAKEYLSDCLENECCKIIEIYLPKYNGVKPMEWVLIWEREEEKLYTLELPNCKHSKRYLCVMVDDKNVYRFSKLNPNVNRQHNHLKCFTQQEIDNLPNQELIKALVKKEVKGI